MQVNDIAIQSISWGKFKGKIPEDPKYYAHINWNIDYRISYNFIPNFVVNLPNKSN